MLDNELVVVGDSFGITYNSFKGYYTITEFDIDNVLDNIGKNKVFNYNGYKFKLDHVRYRVFKEKGVVCKCCGKTGVIALLQFNDYYGVHINFYYITGANAFKLMTIDHTIPASLGGTTTVANLEPMCTRCNSKKGAKINIELLRSYHVDLYRESNKTFNEKIFEQYFYPFVGKRCQILNLRGM